MKEKASERRLAENEVIFRSANEGALKALEAASAEEAEQTAKKPDHSNLTLHFFCECADDKCLERIRMTLKDYYANHTQSNIFIIVPGHEVPEIEKVTKKEADYYVVQKYMTPPQHPDHLHSKKKNLK